MWIWVLPFNFMKGRISPALNAGTLIGGVQAETPGNPCEASGNPRKPLGNLPGNPLCPHAKNLICTESNLKSLVTTVCGCKVRARTNEHARTQGTHFQRRNSHSEANHLACVKYVFSMLEKTFFLGMGFSITSSCNFWSLLRHRTAA